MYNQCIGIANIIWDEDKSTKPKKERGISLDEIAVLILQTKYIDIAKHPKRAGQRMFLIPINGYIHAVPFAVDVENNVALEDNISEPEIQQETWR